MPKKTIKKPQEQQSHIQKGVGQVQTLTAKDVAASVYDTKTGKPLHSMESVSYGFGLKGVAVDVSSNRCLCKVVETPYGPDPKKYYIGTNANGTIIDPVSGGGEGAMLRTGWVAVTQEDFDLYFHDIKTLITTVNITSIRYKYRIGMQG